MATEKAHLIIESFAPGYLDSLGLGFSRLTQIKRRIVLVSITPYGQWGPYSGRKAADLPSLALDGQTSQFIAGVHAFGAAAVAAFAADGSEVPQHIDISVMECLASILAMDLSYYAYYRQEIRQPAGAARSIITSLPSPPFRASALPWRAGRAPQLGEHNEEIYCGELGLSPQELAELRAAGIV